ncbi:MAG: hypothetical protein DRP01_00185 [Archaeoglobales archaeon]|nr:MAG: hypothetical protein DRP01_00185 [Archaeoglobales archaeon]
MIIGIAGQINSGKNTVGDIICDRWEGITMAFADQLKYFILQMFPGTMTKDELWGPSEERSPVARKLLQELGTNVARKHDPDVWVHHLLQRILIFRETGIDPLGLLPCTCKDASIVVTDVRFQNEAIAIRDDLLGCTIKVERPDNYAHTFDKDAANHPSELAVNEIPLTLLHTTIKNDGSLDDLYAKVDDILVQLEDDRC